MQFAAMGAFLHHCPFFCATLRAFNTDDGRVHEHPVRLRRHLAERFLEFMPARETFQLEFDVIIGLRMAAETRPRPHLQRRQQKNRERSR